MGCLLLNLQDCCLIFFASCNRVGWLRSGWLGWIRRYDEQLFFLKTPQLHCVWTIHIRAPVLFFLRMESKVDRWGTWCLIDWGYIWPCWCGWDETGMKEGHWSWRDGLFRLMKTFSSFEFDACYILLVTWPDSIVSLCLLLPHLLGTRSSPDEGSIRLGSGSEGQSPSMCSRVICSHDLVVDSYESSFVLLRSCLALRSGEGLIAVE